MFGYNGYQNNPAVGYQMQANQNRINQLEQQYNPYQVYQQSTQQAQQQVIKGRPVSSYEEAKASMIDLDGSLFVFPDIANGRIYTKQIMMDGTADFRIYNLVVDGNSQGQTEQSGTQEQPTYVLKKDFDRTVKRLEKKIETLKEGAWDEQQNTGNGKSGNEK